MRLKNASPRSLRQSSATSAFKILRLGTVARATRRSALVLLEPPLRPRDARRLHPIARAHLADRFRKIIPNRTLRQPELLGDVAAGPTFSCQPQHLPLTIGQRIEFAPRLRSQPRINPPHPTIPPPHRVGQLLGRAVF